METSSFVGADGFPIDSVAEASFVCTAEPKSCLVLLCKEERENQITETGT